MGSRARRLGAGQVLLGALVVISCTTPNPAFDPSWQPSADGGVRLDGSPGAIGRHADRGLQAADANAVEADADAPPPPPTPPPPSTGLAALCTDGCPAGEVCVFMEENAERGVCLQRCSQPNTFCPVPEPYLAGCATYYNPELGQIDVCVVFCRYQGKEYPCPDETSYRCKRYSPEVSACIAR